MKNILSYWNWFFCAKKGSQGFKKILNLYLILHFIVGIGLSVIVRQSLQQSGNTVLLPLAGIFIGLSFAWIGNALALLQSPEMYGVSSKKEGGFIDYAFTFQTAVLVILITIILWSLAGLGIYDELWPKNQKTKSYFILKTILFSFSSMTLRECWQVVLGSQWMLISQYLIKTEKEK